MKILKLQQKIESLESTCKLFLNQEEKDDEKKEENVVLKIKAFEEILRECKEEINVADEEHKKHVLKLLYGIDLENFNESLEECMQGQVYYQSIAIEERKINNLKSLVLSVDDILEKLALEYKNLQYTNRKWYGFKGIRLKTLKKLLIQLMYLKERLEKQLKKESQKASYVIIDNFYSFYVFLSFFSNLAINKKKELLLIEIASHIDSYIGVIEPSFKNRFLHHDDLIFHYAVYELEELKNSIFKGLAPQ